MRGRAPSSLHICTASDYPNAAMLCIRVPPQRCVKAVARLELDVVGGQRRVNVEAVEAEGPVICEPHACHSRERGAHVHHNGGVETVIALARTRGVGGACSALHATRGRTCATSKQSAAHVYVQLRASCSWFLQRTMRGA